MGKILIIGSGLSKDSLVERFVVKKLIGVDLAVGFRNLKRIRWDFFFPPP